MHELKSAVVPVAAFLFVSVAVPGAKPAQAQGSYPEHSIRLIVPFSPGGQTDNVSRRVGDALTKALGQQIVVDNRSGASGTIGSAEAARANPDGYTLLMGTASTHAINPTVMTKIAYDAVKDFAPIIVLGTGPMTINVHPSVPARNLKQLIADIKAQPGTYSYGSAGVGSVNHLGGELFKLQAGRLEILHVPYRGAGPAVADMMGGQIPMTCTSLSSVLPHHRAGRVRTLAVMSEKRSVSAPDIPTAVEGGVPRAVAYTFNVVLAPAGTPGSVIDHLSRTLRKIMSDRAFVQSLVRLGVDPITDSDPQKAAAMIKTEIRKWQPLIESLGLTS
jgi:tripartite-type tricarboxylate transporter receptor subunit TctC